MLAGQHKPQVGNAGLDQQQYSAHRVDTQDQNASRTVHAEEKGTTQMTDDGNQVVVQLRLSVAVYITNRSKRGIHTSD